MATKFSSTEADASDGIIHIEADHLATNRAMVIKSRDSNTGSTFEWIFELQAGAKPALLIQCVTRIPGQSAVFKNVCQFNFDGSISTGDVVHAKSI